MTTNELLKQKAVAGRMITELSGVAQSGRCTGRMAKDLAPIRAGLAPARQALALRFLLTLCLGLAGQTVAEGGEPMSLVQAVKAGLVHVEIKGLGGSTGDTIEILAQRRGTNPLRLALDPGTVFQSRSASVQRMAGAAIKGERVGDDRYVSSEVIELADDRPKHYIAEAYCMDFEKDNPVDGNGFSLGLVDARVARLLKAGWAASASNEAIQSALWLMDGRVPEVKLRQRFSVNDADMAVARRLVRELRAAEPARGPAHAR